MLAGFDNSQKEHLDCLRCCCVVAGKVLWEWTVTVWSVSSVTWAVVLLCGDTAFRPATFFDFLSWQQTTTTTTTVVSISFSPRIVSRQSTRKSIDTSWREKGERERKQKADKYRSRTAANLLVRSWQLARVAISAIRLWWRQGRCTMAQREAKQCAKWTATQTAPFTLVCLKMQQTYLWSLVSNCTGHPYCQLTGKGEGCFCFLSVLLLLIIIIIWEAKIAQATTDRRRNCKFRWNWQCRKLSVNSSNSSSNSSSYQACDCNESNE